MSIVLKFSKIESEQRPQLITAIHNILTEVGGHNVDIYNAAYWDWQYKQLPSGKSFAYAAWDGEQIIGYYHVATYYCLIDGQERLIGNVQDVAVNPNYRGMGLFRQLAEFANSDLDSSKIDFIYTFPNDKSIGTFLKYNGYQTVSVVPTFIRPVKSGDIIKSKINLLGIEKFIGLCIDTVLSFSTKMISLPGITIEGSAKITDEIETVFKEHSTLFRIHLIRDKAWLKWRYLESARGKCHIICARENSVLTAVLVLKEDEILGNPALIVMDFAYLVGHETTLLFILDSVIRKPEIVDYEFNLIFMSGLSKVNSHIRELGFKGVPSKLNPRVLNLLVRSSSELDQGRLIDKNDWLVTLGDWDIF